MLAIGPQGQWSAPVDERVRELAGFPVFHTQ